MRIDARSHTSSPRAHDRIISRTATQVADAARIARRRPSRLRCFCSNMRTSTRQTPACRSRTASPGMSPSLPARGSAGRRISDPRPSRCACSRADTETECTSDGAIADLVRLRSADKDRARSAVAFGADDFCPDQTQVIAKKIGQRLKGTAGRGPRAAGRSRR